MAETMLAFGISQAGAKRALATPIAERRPSLFGEFREVAIPEPKPGEVLIKVKGAALNYNSVWSLLSHPADAFSLIAGFVRRNPDCTHHQTDFQIVGSDASGSIVKTGAAVRGWKAGDEVVVHCNVVDPNDSLSQIDSLLSPSQAIWGYETNFGAFAEYALVREAQLLPKPPGLDWAVAGSHGLTLSTAYRMLVSPNGAQLRSGEACLIWGAAGGLGAFAIQLTKMLGGTAIAVVSSPEKADFARAQGADFIVNRSEVTGPLVDEHGAPLLANWRKFKMLLDRQYNGPIDVVFEHIGRETLGLSVYLARRGGRIVTCAASSGHNCTIDLRYLWMNVKRIIGSHFANEQEAAEANRLITEGRIRPITSHTISFRQIPEYLDLLHRGAGMGKIAVDMRQASA